MKKLSLNFVMRLLFVASLLATGFAQEECVDAGPEVDIAIPGWKDDAKCFELDFDLDCHIYEAKMNCPKKCKRCEGDCVDGNRDIELDGLGNLFCESVNPSYGDCANANVSVYCPVTCGTCISGGSSGTNDPGCCATNAANVLQNSDAIDTIRDNLKGEETARTTAVADLTGRVDALENNPSGGGGAGFGRLAGAIIGTCDTTFREIAEFDSSAIVKPFQVVCPNNCQPNENVMGTQPFTASSSICAAAAIYGALEPYSADNEDTHVTVVPWTPVRNNYNGVERGPFTSSPSNDWEAGFLISVECPVLSLSIDSRPVGYFFRNVNRPDFKQWVNHNEDNTVIKYFELNTGNYWRMQTKEVDWDVDTCYASGKVMGARIPCESQDSQAECLGTSVAGENGVCFWGRYNAHMLNANGQKVPNPSQKDDVTILRGCTANSEDARASACSTQSIIDCNKLRGDNAEPLCIWAQCDDGMYYSHSAGMCADLPSWAMECDGNTVQRHNESFSAWIQKDPSPQVPMRLDMADWKTPMAYWQQASQCTTQVDISCLEGALLECPGDQSVTTLGGDFRAQVDIRFPMAVMPGMEVTVLLDQYRNVPSTFSAAEVEPGTQVLLPMKALTESTTYIMRYEGRDYLNNMAVSECYIEIRDEEAPTFLSCPTTDVILTLNPGSHQTTIEYQMPTAQDNVDGEVEVTCSYQNGQPWGLLDYSYTVLGNTCTAKDFSNNESTCEFNIIIRDEEAPIWENCITDTRKTNMDFGKPYATVNWQNAIPTATDAAINTPHQLAVKTTIVLPDGREEVIDTNRAIYQFPVVEDANGSLNGWSTVHFEACDQYVSADKPNGNCAYCEFQVHVVDGTPPVLDCPETQFINIASTDEFGNVIPVSYPIPTCTDNYDETCTPEYDFVQPFPGAQLTGQGDQIDRIGSYTVQWSATDASDNWAQCDFKVVLYEGCFTYKFEWNEWIRNDVAYVGLPCRGPTSFAGMEGRGRKKPCETDALYLDLSPTESTDLGGKRYSVWENYFYDDGQQQLIRDYVEVDPSLFGKWKLEFHMRETHHPYRMNQFAFYGELEFNAYGLQEWIWYDPTHVTPFVPIADIKHTLKVTCADNILCPKVTPRTQSTESKEIADAREREIGQRQTVPCANGYFGSTRFGQGMNFCCEADEDQLIGAVDSDPPTWNVCRNNAGSCQPCNRPTCNVFRENTCICEDCAPGYFLTEAGECAPMCEPADIIEQFGQRCDRGITSGFKLGDDTSNCFCSCDDGWDVDNTCSTPEATCPARIDGTIDSDRGTVRNNIPEDERTKSSQAYVPCASGYSGSLSYECRLDASDNSADWYYQGNDCAEYECTIKLAVAGQSCNAACWSENQMTCNARRMNEANDFISFRSVVTKSELGDSCENNKASARAFAPYASESHNTWCYWQSDNQSQCNIAVENEGKRICTCCPGCLVTGRSPRTSLHWDWIGSGNTFFELLDTPNRALLCQNPGGFLYEPYNFSDAMFNTSCNETEEVQMPTVCENTYQDEHWIIAKRNQSCHQACDEIYTDGEFYYECDQQKLNTVYKPLTMRNGAIKAGQLCQKYPPAGNSEPWYPAIDSATDTCYYRYDQSAESRCDTRPSHAGHRRLCACAAVRP